MTNLISQIKKIQIKLYRGLQSVLLLTDFFLFFFLVILFPCKGNHLISRKGIAFSIILIFVTMPGWANPGSSCCLCVFVFRDEGMGWRRKASLDIQQRDSAVCWCTYTLQGSGGNFTLWIIALDCCYMWWRQPLISFTEK